MASLRGLIFDLDGTLVDTLDEITMNLNQALADEGLPAARKRDVRAWVGEGSARLVEQAIPTAEARLRRAVLSALLQRFRNRQTGQATVYPGITALLAALRRRGVALGVLSNKDHEATERVIQSYFDRSLFLTVRGAQPGAERKPDPAVAIEMLRSLGLQASEVAMVGDTRIDIDTASNAELCSIAVTWGFRDRLELAGADWLVDEPGEILEIVGRDDRDHGSRGR